MKKLLAFPVMGMLGLSVIGFSYFVVGVALAAVLVAVVAVPVLTGMKMFGPRLYEDISTSTYLQ
ncbi:MAG TPA: hypothetical protein VMT17_15900 [Anaeromyxobacteraceae bacterium]|nr:hypothetical protein [Anaeromyxobacteraceae bacterium]